VRARLKQIPNEEVLQGCEVIGLVGELNGVEGVRLRLHGKKMDFVDEILWADIVIAATGRHSKAARWLKELGLPEPEVDCIDAHIGYASRMFLRPRNPDGDWRAIFVQAAPPEVKRAGILFPVEGNRWLVTLQGGDRDYPPSDDTGFLEFARSLRSPMLYEAIADAEPFTPISSYRATENRLRHYERLRVWPERFLVMGDAVCAFNPVYGQGMTAAALASENLRGCLAKQKDGLNGLAQRFQKRLARINQAPWMLATSEDLRFAGTEGAIANRSTKFMHRYVARVLQLATHHRSVRKSFLEVQGMLKGPGERPGYQALLSSIDVRGQLIGRDPVHQSLYLWSKTFLPGYILTMLGDRMEMAHSVEGRVPFLDHHLVELVRSQPVTQKIHGMTEKYVLREAVRDVITDTVYRRQKHPFLSPPATLNPKQKLGTFVQDTLRSPVLATLPFFNQKKVLGVLDRLNTMDEGSRVANDLVLMTIVSACVLQERFRLAA
jgi:2-polyprenyl-6-methoxyphenol hydroxylase-like FAD-dependent oxidoreductase